MEKLTSDDYTEQANCWTEASKKSYKFVKGQGIEATIFPSLVIAFIDYVERNSLATIKLRRLICSTQATSLLKEKKIFLFLWVLILQFMWRQC